MTCSRKCRERLMCLASRSSAPSNPVLITRSDPARSTKLSRLRRTTSSPACRASRCRLNMQCERLEAWLSGVSATVRLVSPRNSCMGGVGGQA